MDNIDSAYKMISELTSMINRLSDNALRQADAIQTLQIRVYTLENQINELKDIKGDN